LQIQNNIWDVNNIEEVGIEGFYDGWVEVEVIVMLSNKL